jgi:predicted ATP-dependent Lon-type protease
MVVQVFTNNTPGMAADMGATLKEDSQTEAVRKFEYDPVANALVVDLGSVYQTASFIADYAWQVTQGVSAFYASMMDSELAVMEKIRPYLPGFHLTVNRKHFFSNAEMMIKIGHKEADQLDWKAALNK